MLFNSIHFAVFLPIVFLLYWAITPQKIKSQNNWDFFKKGKMNYIEKFPNIVELINKDINLDTIVEMTKIKKTTIWRIKVQMHKAGILKVKYNLRKKDK